MWHNFAFSSCWGQVIFLNLLDWRSGHNLWLLGMRIDWRFQINIIIINMVPLNCSCISLLSLVHITTLGISAQSRGICTITSFILSWLCNFLIIFSFSIIHTLAVSRQNLWIARSPFTNFSFAEVCYHRCRFSSLFFSFLCHFPLPFFVTPFLSFFLTCQSPRSFNFTICGGRTRASTNINITLICSINMLTFFICVKTKSSLFSPFPPCFKSSQPIIRWLRHACNVMLFSSKLCSRFQVKTTLVQADRTFAKHVLSHACKILCVTNFLSSSGPCCRLLLSFLEIL